MAANDPIVEKIIIDCKKIMQFYCGTYNQLFKMGTSDVKINGELFFVGKDKILGNQSHLSYSMVAESRQSDKSDIGLLEIEAGKFLMTTYNPKNFNLYTGSMATDETIDGPLMITVKMNDKYNFVGLVVVGAENKTGVFSIIDKLSNDALKEKLLYSNTHIHCFKNKHENFFTDGEFKPGISTKELELAAAEIRRLKEPCSSKKQEIKTQERINAIEEALKRNSPEKLHLLLEKKSFSFCNFFSYPRNSKKKESKSDNFDKDPRQLPVVYRKLST